MVVFQISKKIFQITTLSLKFEKVVYCYWLEIQDSDLECFFWRFDKHITLSEKKLPLENLVVTLQIFWKSSMFSLRLMHFEPQLLFLDISYFGFSGLYVTEK